MKNRFLEMIKDKGKRTLIELIAGVVVVNLISLVAVIFVKNKAAYAIGQLLGLSVAVFLAIHMYKSLEKVLLLNKSNAKTKTRLNAFLRMLVMFGALAVSVIYVDYINPIPVMIGILALKLSAEAQALTELGFTRLFGPVPNNTVEATAIEPMYDEDSDMEEIEAVFGRNEELNTAIKEAMDFKPEEEILKENNIAS